MQMDDPDPPNRNRPLQDLAGDLDEAAETLADLGGDAGAIPAALREEAASWTDRQSFEALARVGRAISATLDFQALVRQILDIAVQHLVADRGILYLGGSAQTELVPIAARSVKGEDLRELGQLSRTILRRTLAGQTVSSADALSDPDLRQIPSVRLAEIRSILCVPLIAREEVTGAIYVDHYPTTRVFPEQARRFLEAFAGIAAIALENARLHGELRRENEAFRRGAEPTDAFDQIVTASPKMVALLRQARLVAVSDAPIMLIGESGTGKELLARAIHRAGPRAARPFVPYNCAAVPHDLMESLFFGHVRGAFTGAVRDNPGLFRQADQGVLFLDEVTDLNPALQGKLLRVLQDGLVRPIGGDREHRVDVRLITATSQSIEDAVRAGRFREDLFFRTNVLELQVPPLRERPEDVPTLLEHFLRKHAKRGRALSFTPAAVEFMQQRRWQGNVRELENLVQRALVFLEGHRAGVEVVRKLLSRLEDGVAEASGETVVPKDSGGPADLRLRTKERETILKALRQTGGNRSRAASLLGVHRNSLLRRMKRLGIRAD